MTEEPESIVSAGALYAALGSRIRAEREAVGVTQEGLARATHLSRSSIANIERGSQAVTLHGLFRLAQALDRTPCELLPGMPDGADEVDPQILKGFEGGAVASQWIARVVTSSDDQVP
jgi:transcriptional regulator with XRE-family HTH domain